MNVMGEREMNQYLYTKLVAGSLCTNDTLAFHEKRTQFDSIVKMSHLRAQVMQIYNQTKSYLKIHSLFPTIYYMVNSMKTQSIQHVCHIWNLSMMCSKRIMEK